MATDGNKIPYIHVDETYGGTYDMTDIERIGTFNCVYCVGVYFKIRHQKNLAFCAHIQPGGHKTTYDKKLTPLEGLQLKQVMLDRLTEHATC
ncbi:unnamed protein product, partial [marine sediment metagenome]